MKRKTNSSLIWIFIFFVLFPFKIKASELDETLKNLIEKNDLHKAQEFLVEYLESNPEDGDAKFYLGKIHFDGDSSLKYLSEVIDLTAKGEKSAEALLWMCKYSFLNGSYSITLEQTKEFEKRFNQSIFLPEILWISGCSYLITGYREEAQKQYRQVWEGFPQSEWAPWALLGMGDCSFSKNEFVQAITQYRKLIDLYVDSDALPLALISLCRSCVETKDPDSALLYYNFYEDRFPAGVMKHENLFERIRAELAEKIKEERKRRKATKYTIQIGVFSSKNQAEKEYRKFKSLGYTTGILEVSKDQEALWSVEVGIFDSKKKAESFKNKLERQFGKTYKVISR